MELTFHGAECCSTAQWKSLYFPGSAICYSGIAGANDNYNWLLCLSSGWVKLQGGVEIQFVQRACVVVWVVSCGEGTGSNGLKSKKLSSYSASSWENQDWNWTFCLSAEWKSERPQSRSLFWFRLKPRRNTELGGCWWFLQKVWVLCFYMLPVVMSGFFLSRGLQMYSMGSSHQSTHFCVISVGKGKKKCSRWFSRVNGLTDLFRIG